MHKRARSLLLIAAALPLSAACAAPTQSYSFTRKAISAHDMTVAVYRDGPRETIKLSRASGWHSQMWFDFAAHKQYGEVKWTPNSRQ